MKKTKRNFILLLWIVIVLLILSACTPRSIKKRMEKYYSDDSNYVPFVGTVIDLLPFNEDWTLRIYQNDIDGFVDGTLSDYEERFVTFILTKQCFDKIKENSFELQIGEQYLFTSSTGYWYDGFDYPMVEIKDIETGVVYLDFEFGKESYINWIWNVLR